LRGGCHGGPGWRHRWGLHEIRYTGMPLHMPYIAAALHIAAAVAALGSAYIVLRGYRVARDRRMLWSGAGLLLVAVASLLEAALYVGLLDSPAIVAADGFYVLGYALILFPENIVGGEGAAAITLLGGMHFAGSIAAGVLALMLSISTPVSVGAAFLVLAVSHFLDSVIAFLDIYNPALTIAAALLRITGLNILLIALLLPAARVGRGEREEA